LTLNEQSAAASVSQTKVSCAYIQASAKEVERILGNEVGLDTLVKGTAQGNTDSEATPFSLFREQIEVNLQVAQIVSVDFLPLLPKGEQEDNHEHVHLLLVYTINIMQFYTGW